MADYQVKFETLTIANVDFTIRSLRDNQQFSDPNQEAEKLGISSALWPLFGVIWPSGLVLAEIVSRFPLQGQRILEIGCGIALSSLVTHQRGADITASDYHPLAASFLAKNVALNHLPPLKFQTGNWLTANPSLGKFDLIIGSDVLYESIHPRILSQFIDRHANPQAQVTIVDPGRSNHGKFSREMIALDYSYIGEKIETQTILSMPFKGRILNYSRKGIY